VIDVPAPNGGVPAFEQDPTTDALVREMLRIAVEPPAAVLLFGSRLAGTTPGAHSAYDLILLLDDYRAFYRRLHDSGRHRRSPAVLGALARVLAPNIIAFDAGLPGGALAKVMVLTQDDFARGLSRRAPDHFLRGRLVQRVVTLWVRDATVAFTIDRLLADARRDVLRWAAPWLPTQFTAGELIRSMLEVSYAGEVRPESAERVAAVFEAQRNHLEPTYRKLLEEAEADGRVVRVTDAHGPTLSWRLADPATLADGVGWRLYFARSKIRATTRWLKHVVTFDDWLTYIQRKVQRRTGMVIEVTPMERRMPLILLWPKVFRVLGELRRAKREGPASNQGGAR
jgi:hypothetical protein